MSFHDNERKRAVTWPNTTKKKNHLSTNRRTWRCDNVCGCGSGQWMAVARGAIARAHRRRIHEELSLSVFHMAHDPIRSILRNRQRWIIHAQLIAIRARLPQLTAARSRAPLLFRSAFSKRARPEGSFERVRKKKKKKKKNSKFHSRSIDRFGSTETPNFPSLSVVNYFVRWRLFAREISEIIRNVCHIASDVNGTAAGRAGGATFLHGAFLDKRRSTFNWQSGALLFDFCRSTDNRGPRYTKNLALAYCFTSVREHERTNKLSQKSWASTVSLHNGRKRACDGL